MKVNFYDRIFYSYYLITKRLGNSDVAFSVLLLMCLILGLNALSVVFYFFEPSELPLLNKFDFLIMMLPFYAFNYFYFLRSKRYLELEEELKNVNERLYINLGVTSIVLTVLIRWLI